MPNVMAAMPNIGGTLWSTPQNLADAQYWSAVQQRCQDAKPFEICRGAPNYRPAHVVQCIGHSDATCGRVWRARLPLFRGSIQASVR